MPSLRSFFSHPRLFVALWALVLFAATLTLDLRHNRFPYFYHPDEPGKVDQVLNKRWNFHHPMLLLSATTLAVEVFHVPAAEQPVVETGRTVSAIFTALAVVALSLTAYFWQGWTAAIIAGVALATHHQLYELAHYMKEDSALLFGLSFSFLAALLYVQGPSTGRALFLGGACGLAIAGKYLGIVCLAVAIPALWHTPPPWRRRHLVFALAASAVVFAIIDVPLLLDLGTLDQSLRREMNFVVHGQGDVTRRIPHPLYWNVFLINSTPVIWLLLLAFFTRTRVRPTGEILVKRILTSFPLAFALMLSFSPKENDRYFLPATALFTLLAALGVVHTPDLCARLLQFFGVHRPERFFTLTLRRAIVWGLAASFWALQLTGWSSTKPGLWRYDRAFQQDDIADLAAWMRKELPANAIVVADNRAGLQEANRKKPADRVTDVPQKLIVNKLAADGGSLDDLRAQGVGYVVVSETSYGRFFREDLRAKNQDDSHYLKAKAFYDQLLREGELLFQRDRGTVIYLHPGIRVYKL